jgi:hypothetical protein
MRKIALFILLLGICAAPASAQTIGFKIGPTFSKLDFDADEANDFAESLTSFGGGGFIRFGMAGLALQAEVLAITKGTEFEFGTDDASFELTYVEIPLTAMFALGRGPYVFAGPFVGFEVSCKGSFGDLSSDCDENDGSRNEIDYGLTGGLGIHFPMGPGSLLLEGRYTHGLANLNEETTDPTDPGDIKTRYFAAFIGYAIRIGR